MDAAVASALTEETEEGEPEAVPFGSSWNFDFEQGRFVHEGSGAMRVYGGTALSMWCLMALHSTRFAHDVFSEAFGVESVDDLIGSVMAARSAAEYEARMRDALLVHDRIVALEDFTVEFDPADDALYVSRLHGGHRRGRARVGGRHGRRPGRDGVDARDRGLPSNLPGGDRGSRSWTGC